MRKLALSVDVEQIEGMLAQWKEKPWTISYYRGGDHMHFRVLQFEMDSIKELEEKLAQFPQGSAFFVSAGGYEEDKIIAQELSEFLSSHSMKLASATK